MDVGSCERTTQSEWLLTASHALSPQECLALKGTEDLHEEKEKKNPLCERRKEILRFVNWLDHFFEKINNKPPSAECSRESC
jgi:hypothetical protein